MCCSARLAGVECFESDEQASQSGGDRPFEQIALEDRIHRAGGLPHPAHAAHAVEERRREAPVAEQVVVEKVQVTPGQALDFRKRRIDGLRVKPATALEERVLVAEIADVRTTARDDDRVRHEIPCALDQIAPHSRQPVERADPRLITPGGRAASIVVEKLRPGIFAGPEKNRVRMRCGLLGQRRYVQAAEHDISAAFAVMVGQTIRPPRRRDVDLDDDQVRAVLELQPLDMLVLNFHVIVVAHVPGERGETERRKQRILDRTPEGARGFGERRQDHLDLHRPVAPRMSTDRSRG